jgi:hypothetical protein
MFTIYIKQNIKTEFKGKDAMARRHQFESQYVHVYTDDYIVSLKVIRTIFHCKLDRDLFAFYYIYYTSKRVQAHTQFINVNLHPVLGFR